MSVRKEKWGRRKGQRRKEGRRKGGKEGGRKEGSVLVLICMELIGNSHLFRVNENNFTLTKFGVIPGRKIVLGHKIYVIDQLDHILAELPSHVWVYPPVSTDILGDDWILGHMYGSQSI